MPIKDATANQIGGCSASLIGLDTNTVYAAKPPHFALDTAITVQRIGGATAGSCEDPRYSGKALKLEQATGAVADAGVVANTYLNHTGQALVSGNVVVAAAP